MVLAWAHFQLGSMERDATFVLTRVPNLCKRGKDKNDETYEEDVMPVTAKNILKCLNGLPDEVTDKNGNEIEAWKRTTAIYSVQGLNDSSFFTGKTVLESEQLNHSEESVE